MAHQTATRKRSAAHDTLQLPESQALRKMTFSQLDKDVMVEIFRQFVAVDWDGPFTLTLVCTKWSDLVLSTPVLWTWIMVDDSQIEWLERMEVAACLSKHLPLQVVLRPPFDSQISIYHVTHRCVALYVDSKRTRHRYDSWPRRWLKWSRTIVPYEDFTEESEAFKHLNDSISRFLKNVTTSAIQIFSEDNDDACFAYSAWHVYEALNRDVHLRQALGPGQDYIITALVFKHADFTPLPRTQLPIADLWVLLPSLGNLSYLELSDNYIKMQKDTTLARISLPSIKTLKIEAPTPPWPSFSFEADIWLGLFSLLDFLTVPNIEYLTLNGSIHRIIALMRKNYVKLTPSNLHLSFSILDKAIGELKTGNNAVWHRLRRCSISFPEPRKNYINGEVEWPNLKDAARLFLSILPNDCSVQLQGGNEIRLLVPYIPSELSLHLFFFRTAWPEHEKLIIISRRITSVTLRDYSDASEGIKQWAGGAEEVYLEGESILIDIQLASFPHARTFASYADFTPNWDAATPYRFSNLTDLRCTADSVARVIRISDLPQLLYLTLLEDPDDSLGPVSAALTVIKIHSRKLPQMHTIGIDDASSGKLTALFKFVAWSNRSAGRAITAVKLPSLPHPYFLRFLGMAFKGDDQGLDGMQDRMAAAMAALQNRDISGCYRCAWSRWSCYAERLCHRSSDVDLVTITSDMPLNKYQGGLPDAWVGAGISE